VLDTSNDCVQESGGAGSTARGSVKRQPPASVEDPEPSTEDSEDGATCPQKRAALGTACHSRVAREPSHELGRQPPTGSMGHHHHKRRQEEVYTSSDNRLMLSERDTDPTDSDQGEHDDRQPKRRNSASDFGASKWTTEEWRLLTSGDVSDLHETSVDDGRPRTHTNPSKSKTKWSATKVNTQIKYSLKLLKGRKKEAPFRALKLPYSIDWLEPELMRGKTLEDAELRANTAGMCGFSGLALRRLALMPARFMP
jgi:hypothetical protein